MKTKGERVPLVWLERAALDELDPEREAALERLLRSEPDGGAKIERLSMENAATLAAHPPRAVADEVRRRLARRERAGAPARGWLVAAVAASVTALGLTGLLGLLDRGDTRLKGGLELLVYRQRAEGAEPLAPGAHVNAGDRLQLRLIAEPGTYGAVLSLDGRGEVTLHLPAADVEKRPVRLGGTLTLPTAYVLDSAPRFERFVAVTSPSPFPLDDVVAAARSLARSPEARTGPLPLGPGSRYTQTSVLLDKDGS